MALVSYDLIEELRNVAEAFTKAEQNRASAAPNAPQPDPTAQPEGPAPMRRAPSAFTSQFDPPV